MFKSKQGRKTEPKGKDNPTPGCSGRKTPDSTDEHDFGFPVLKMVDKASQLHCFSAILNRSKDEPVTMEELDRLQPELEMMLSNAAVRLKNLHAEVSNLNNAEDSRAESKHLSHKKRKLSEARVSKSMKDLSKVRDREAGVKMEGSNSENETDNSAEVLFDSTKRESSKNDITNKFWASVEPYAGDITSEGIKELEALIAVCDNDMAGVKIPPLGRHYTIKWAEEDLNQEKEASTLKQRRSSVNSDTESRTLLKKANSLCNRERVAGPLVQRLVSALMEEQSPLQESFMNNKIDENDSSVFLSKLPMFHTSMCFERRVRRELELSGFLENSMNVAPGEDMDEILQEIKKCDEELKAVASQNKKHLEQLLQMAHKEVQRQEVKSKLKAIDGELIEVYRKAVTAKLKKKQLQKKEKDQAWKMLRDREALLQALEAV